MKVYSLSLLSINGATPGSSTLLVQVNDLSSFSFYQRGSVGEFMGFFTKVSVISSRLYNECWGHAKGAGRRCEPKVAEIKGGDPEADPF